MERERHNARYLLVSPCRDEVEYCQETLDSVLAQSSRPALWVIVDDGSTDGTSAILDRYAARHPDVIRVVRRRDRGRRSVGPGVVDAFYAGLETVDLDHYDYLCKLDLDLRLPPDYFATLVAKMEAEPRLGTCSGKPYFVAANGELVSEAIGDEVSAGMTKFYRVACFREIGGFVREVMWDGIDCHRCRQAGWMASSWDEPALRFVHLRPMGSSDQSILEGRMRHGRGQYFMGTGLGYMAASALFRMTRRPWIVGGAAMMAGYLQSMWRRSPRYDDAAFRQYLRRFQRECLLRGKKAATGRIHSELAS
ncbi:MAG: glycosyltransferase family A protein [Planctomycetota bacterium]